MAKPGEYVMRIVMNMVTGQVYPENTFLKSFNPIAHDGRGEVNFADSMADAHGFPDVWAAWNLWHAVPQCRPTRPDGKPNKPLTAFTIETLPVPGRLS